ADADADADADAADTATDGSAVTATAPAGTPSRLVIQAEALAWLREHAAEPADAVVTSLPDVSELPELGPGLGGWQRWFVEAASQLMRWPEPSSVSLFYQSDIRHQGL